MPHPPSQQVFDVLSASHANLQREALLGDGFHAALWLREQLEDVAYEHPDHHTLSLYLEDGFDVFIQGRPEQRGGPGKLCLLPADHQSYWRIDGRIRFIHFYFSQQQLDQLVVRMLDREPRAFKLQQRIYMQDPRLAAACRQLARLDWQSPSGRLEANAHCHALLSYLLLNFTAAHQPLKLRGGLSPLQRRRALEMIDARLATELTLGELANELAMSEYHFAHMFRQSVGETPHRWIMRQRLARARSLLIHSHQSLDAIANQTGFSHLSHLTRHLQAELGVTPGAYRRWGQMR